MGDTVLRGIRGAITVEHNTAPEILSATKELLQAVIKENSLEPEDIASVFFTVTQDLNAEFPAFAARGIGLKYVPLLCSVEINVPGSLEKCIRLLVHANTKKSQREISHIYLKKATRLREDLKEF